MKLIKTEEIDFNSEVKNLSRLSGTQLRISFSIKFLKTQDKLIDFIGNLIVSENV